MQQNLKQHLFYNIDQLSTAVGINQSITLFSATGTPLAERAAETLITAVNAQNSITNSLHRDRIQSLTYSAYGQSHIDHILGYTGQRCDRFTNLYLLGNGYRAYSPYLMRFYSPDNLSPFGKGGRNAYAYCEGDPTNNLDPSGQMLRKTLDFFKLKRDTSTLSPNNANPYYNDAVKATETFPALAKFPKWYDSPHTQGKHLEKAAKLIKHKETLENWEPNNDVRHLLNDEAQADNITTIYMKKIKKTTKLIEKVYTPPEEAVVIRKLPSPPANFSFQPEQSSVRGQTK
ncbi:RHS repeat-associated core domain-containing protein [Pseudomonas putida]|uniref:RHS repeat-associated core domain-containing protein n=1 Tax=Pseudomonas putida TaxID=303 RepID=UPI00107552D2|nr:RHS repeat-associated core domain-containing protein [Pseudomonas putida]TFW40033.1 RHS repeat-associated core domain-containing protein [Pseudomonas putida]